MPKVHAGYGSKIWLRKVLANRAVLCAVISGIFIMGAIAGAAASSTFAGSERQELTGYVQNVLGTLAEQGATSGGGLIGAFTEQVVKTAGLIWFLGLSVVGAPLVAAVVFLRGFALGFACSFLIADLAWRGVLVALIALAPQNILIIPGLIWVAASAVAFSFQALCILLGRRPGERIGVHLREEGALAICGCLLLTAGGLVEAYIVPVTTALVSRYIM